MIVSTSQKFQLKAFYYNKKVKELQNLSNKEVYFTLQYNSYKYCRLFKFISCPNFL